MSEALDKYLQAGKIAARLKDEAPKIVKVGVSLLEVCQRFEELTIKLGARPAFPVNIGVNEVTAHYTSPSEDPAVIPEGSLVKVDVGAHIDGYIADTAMTFAFSSVHEALVITAQEALRNAIDAMRPGVKISEVGAVVEKTMAMLGHKPIRNLMGHRIERYKLHTGKSIPNVSGLGVGRIQEGEVYAVEPFSTLHDAAGVVRDASQAYIFRYNKEKRLKSPDATALLEYVRKEHRFLPFASRWLRGDSPISSFDLAFTELLESKCVLPYRVLVEASGQPVAQAEHTVIVEKNGCRIIT